MAVVSGSLQHRISYSQGIVLLGPSLNDCLRGPLRVNERRDASLTRNLETKRQTD